MKLNKEQWSWVFYDWANSGYGIIVTTAVLPIYFKTIAQANGVTAANATAFWAMPTVSGRYWSPYWRRFWGHWQITKGSRNAS